MEDRKSNYQIQNERAQLEFIKWDHEAIAHKFGLMLDTRFLYVQFVARQYRIDRQTGAVESSPEGAACGKPADFNEIMSIFDLFNYSKSAPKLSGTWTGIQNVSQMAQAGPVAGRGLFAPFAESFSGRCEELAQACRALGGTAAGGGDVSFVLKIFDCLPVLIQFWDADDEFPAQLNLYWDKNILDFVHFETTFFMASHLLGRILELMR